MPRTNSAIHHILLTSCTLKCLTIFPISSSNVRIRSTYFSLSGYELCGDNWQLNLIDDIASNIRKINVSHPECPLAKSNAEFKRCARNLVFLLEFLINNRVCLIYEGNSTPGHSSKSSLLNREF